MIHCTGKERLDRTGEARPVLIKVSPPDQDIPILSDPLPKTILFRTGRQVLEGPEQIKIQVPVLEGAMTERNRAEKRCRDGPLSLVIA